MVDQVLYVHSTQYQIETHFGSLCQITLVLFSLVDTHEKLKTMENNIVNKCTVVFDNQKRRRKCRITFKLIEKLSTAVVQLIKH